MTGQIGGNLTPCARDLSADVGHVGKRSTQDESMMRPIDGILHSVELLAV